ncbi:MAG: thiamine phosphate synthase [Polyangiaceae bacterium]|nr:thiamine phosphate synthase [Polyangiaceae bacterium]
MRGLYAIVDVDTLDARGIDPAAFAEAVLDARPAAIQVRDKNGTARRTLALLHSIGGLARRAGVPLFANDRPDLAILADCDGVHVGQEDLPISAVREFAAIAAREPPLRVGISTHDQNELENALRDGPDYVAIGPIFSTVSKQNPSPVVGLDELKRRCAMVRARAPTVPVVAIGGISSATAAQVGAVCDAVAVIGALVPAERDSFFENVRQRADALSKLILGAAT